MPNNKSHITLKECRPCVVLMQDTFDGVLSDRMPNNCRMQISTPLAYFRALQKQLDDKLHQRGVKGSYMTDIKVNPKDNRSFLSATFRYGRRLLTYTNVASIAKERTNEKTTFCVRHTIIVATRTQKVTGNADKYVSELEETFLKEGYKGGILSYKRADGKFYRGDFDHKEDDKKISVTSHRKSKRTIIFTLVRTTNVIENVYTKDKPQIWVRNMDRLMKEHKFVGEIRTHVNSNDKLIIDGKYTKTSKVDNGTNAYTVMFYNQMEKRSTSVPVEDPDSWRPTKKVGNTYAQVRSIAQDDSYTAEFQGKKINWDRIEIDKLYREYLQMPGNEVELAQKRLDAMNERAASKGQKAALKWLRSIKKTKPAWLEAPNALSLVLYCIKYIEREVMTPSEATNFCKTNAYKK